MSLHHPHHRALVEAGGTLHIYEGPASHYMAWYRGLENTHGAFSHIYRYKAWLRVAAFEAANRALADMIANGTIR